MLDLHWTHDDDDDDDGDAGDDDDDDDGDSGVKPPKICPHQADHWSQSILKSWSEGRGESFAGC